MTSDGHLRSEADYIAAVEAHLQAVDRYDDLLPIQAADLDFLKGFYALCRAGFTRHKPVEAIGFFASTAVADYRRLGRESSLVFLEEAVRMTLTGTLLTEYRADALTLERAAPVETKERTPQAKRSAGRSALHKRVRGLFSASIIGSFVGAWLVVLVVGIAQLAAVNEGLISWGAPWWLAMLLAPPVGFVPVIGTIIGSIGAVRWGLHPVLAVVGLLLPGRRQFVLYVLSRRRREHEAGSIRLSTRRKDSP